jgi:hypothetical protein
MIEINQQCKMSNYRLAMQDQKGSITNGFIIMKTMIWKIRPDLPLLKGGMTPLGLLFSLLIAN